MDQKTAKFFRAFNPYLRILDGKEPVTEETKRLSYCAEMRIEHDKVQAFVERENQTAPSP